MYLKGERQRLGKKVTCNKKFNSISDAERACLAYRIEQEFGTRKADKRLQDFDSFKEIECAVLQALSKYTGKNHDEVLCILQAIRNGLREPKKDTVEKQDAPRIGGYAYPYPINNPSCSAINKYGVDAHHNTALLQKAQRTLSKWARGTKQRRTRAAFGHGKAIHRSVSIAVKAEMTNHLELLEKAVKSKDYAIILPFGDDKESLASMSDYDWRYVEEKAVTVGNALRAYIKSDGGESQHITWAEACELGAQQYKWESNRGRTVQRWYLFGMGESQSGNIFH
mmetsp:Transcript_33372/g.48297  ORF Transcript_33372/g.48297 Transcript_33372/m.48297 type:complete len:282 (+) Transcript_33372:339-1184(+)